ncbi:protein of unknown function [Burkholderia multivorans]
MSVKGQIWISARSGSDDTMRYRNRAVRLRAPRRHMRISPKETGDELRPANQGNGIRAG